MKNFIKMLLLTLLAFVFIAPFDADAQSYPSSVGMTQEVQFDYDFTINEPRGEFGIIVDSLGNGFFQISGVVETPVLPSGYIYSRSNGFIVHSYTVPANTPIKQVVLDYPSDQVFMQLGKFCCRTFLTPQ